MFIQIVNKVVKFWSFKTVSQSKLFKLIKAYDLTIFAPTDFKRLIAAFKVPPVATASSTITTRSPDWMQFFWISKLSYE
jgi:hypothetical protein